MDTTSSLKHFLEIPYDTLEEMNLQALEKADSHDPEKLKGEYLAYLKKEKDIKAVTLCFSNIEGRFHMLDYDKKFFLDSYDNLTFDGSSIRGFTMQHESDLRLDVDWSSIRWLPSDIFGPGKVVMFANILNRDRTLHQSDFRGRLKEALKVLAKDNTVAYASTEIEGFLVDGLNAEQLFKEEDGFELISTGGYYHSLPLDRLRQFIDKFAEAQRAMGFKNEKDHPEVAPSQFELNFSYTHALRTADNIQLYKLIGRQVANNMGMTATFLPKPMTNINGSGMHLNFSLSKNGKNMFYKKNGEEQLSPLAWEIVSKVLNHASDICLVLNSSVNAYRRLDPHYEAPNQIKVSAVDRGSMIRIPIANEKSSRIEIRSVAPDSNPYMVLYTILQVIEKGSVLKKDADKRERLRYLPGNIYDAIKLYKSSDFMTRILGEDAKEKFVYFKTAAADRSPRELGTRVKRGEVLYHHEVTNQMLWNKF